MKSFCIIGIRSITVEIENLLGKKAGLAGTKLEVELEGVVFSSLRQ